MLKRPLVSAVLLFVFGIFLATYSVNLIIMVILCASVCVFTYLRTKKPAVSLLAVGLILAGVFRMGIAQNYQNSIIAEYSGKEEHMKMTATEFSSESSVTAYFKDGNRKHKVFLTVEENTELSPGDVIEGEFSLYAPFISKTRFPSQRESFSGNNIFLTAFAEKVTMTDKKESGLSGGIYSLRVYMDSLGEKAFSGNDRALFNAMIFGDKRLVSDELYSALQASGLNHIAVVSGMHLSVAIAFMTVFARKIFGKKRTGYVFILAGTFLLTLITGAGASVIRAFIMCILFLLSQLLRRDQDSATSLAFAVIVMTGINPFIIFNLGFVLSVLSVMGIFLFNDKVSEFLIGFMPLKLAKVLSLSISAQLTVLPVTVYYFGTLTPYSLLSNVLLVPIAGIYVILGMLYVLFSSIPFVLSIISPCIILFSEMMTATCFSVKGFDYSLISFSGSLIIFFAVWIFLLVLLRVRPFTQNKRHILAAAFTLVIILICLIPEKTGVTIYTVPYGTRNMTAIVNSEGDSFLIDSPILYDMAQIEDSEAPFLSVVITNTSLGQALKGESSIERAFVPEAIFNEKKRAKLLESAKEQNVYVNFMGDFEKFYIGNVLVEYIAVDGIEGARAVKIEYDSKTLITLQGFKGKDVAKMERNGVTFDSDYIILPFTAISYGEEFFTGEILK